MSIVTLEHTRCEMARDGKLDFRKTGNASKNSITPQQRLLEIQKHMFTTDLICLSEMTFLLEKPSRISQNFHINDEASI